MNSDKRILISRTDSIGDVVLTLPVAALLRKKHPGAKILFLGRSYTQAVVERCPDVDEFYNWDEIEKLSDKEAAERIRSIKASAIIHVFPRPRIAKLAKKAGIPVRIGVSGRLYHWLTCNRIVRMSRRKSNLHEAVLNTKLLEPLGIDEVQSIEEIRPLINLIPPAHDFSKLIDPGRFNVILHPGSRGSAREWGVENYQKLIDLLPADRYKVFITGTKAEGEALRSLTQDNSKVTDLTGKFSLEELMAFINTADGLVAASTGPLHLAAAFGKIAVGLYSPMRPIHPGRWAPIGTNAHYLVFDPECKLCKEKKDCDCIKKIAPSEVMKLLVKADPVKAQEI